MNIGVFFGGRSCEHNVSIITGMQTISALKHNHNVMAIYIDNSGNWWTDKNFDKISSFSNVEKVLKKAKRVHMRPNSNYIYNDKGKKLFCIDCAFLALHGFGGEDGAIQGILTLSNVPYTGSDICSSAVCFDKTFTKRMFSKARLPQVKYVSFSREEFKNDREKLIKNIEKKCQLPCIIKPAKMGSSIGIFTANNTDELCEGVEGALNWDNSVVVESLLTDYTEFNCAVVGDELSQVVSEIEEPIGFEKFLTYEDKYTKKTKGSGRNFPCEIEGELREKIKTLAEKAFVAAACRGVARVDFLYSGGNLYVNEINTIPGAMANYLFSAGDNIMSFAKLCDTLIGIAIRANERLNAVEYVYKSSYSLLRAQK